MSKDHYLPQFYLRGFRDKHKQLHYCRVEFDTYRSTSTSGIYYSPGLNNIDLGKNGTFNLEEVFFKEKDNCYSKAFEDMREKYFYDIHEMPAQVKADIVEFVLGLYWRVPGGLKRVIDLLENEGIVDPYVDPNGRIYTNKDVPNIIQLLKENEEYQKVLMPTVYDENVAMHNWFDIDRKFYIYETYEPLIIGDIPFVPLKSENKRGKILEEFMIPLDMNHVLVYAENHPKFLESNLLYHFNLCVIDGASEKISCCDENYLKEMIKRVKPIKERFGSMGIRNLKDKLLAPLLEFESQFDSFQDFVNRIKSDEFKNLATQEAIDHIINKFGQ